MSALEAARTVTAQATEAARVAQAAAASAARDLTDAINKERRIANEETKTKRAAEVAQERKNHDATFGQDRRWIGVEGKTDVLDFYIHEHADFHGVVELTREEAIVLRDYLIAKYQD